MSHGFGTIEELGEGYGFRKVRQALGVEDEERLLGPGGMVHVSSTTPRRISNGGRDDLVMLVVGGKGGYVGRDGHMVDEADIERRASFGSGSG